MNDAEIIKAFRSCRVNNICTEKCPCYTSLKCTEGLDKSILSIIKRYKAKIVDERGKKEICAEVIKRLEAEKSVITADRNELLKDKNRLEELLKTSRAEAIKEFAERVHGKAHYSEDFNEMAVCCFDIDSLVKEMTEGDK